MLHQRSLEESINARLQPMMNSFREEFMKDMKEEMKKLLKDVLKDLPKRPKKRPSVEVEPEVEKAWQPQWDIYPEDCPEEEPHITALEQLVSPEPQLIPKSLSYDFQKQYHVDSRTNPFQVGGDDVILPSTDRQVGLTDSPTNYPMADPMENPDQHCKEGLMGVQMKIWNDPEDDQTHDQMDGWMDNSTNVPKGSHKVRRIKIPPDPRPAMIILPWAFGILLFSPYNNSRPAQAHFLFAFKK